ncbi:hypothetical protein ACQV2T_04200 [Facklamia sp. P13069]|uniref:hypothetical protein n=1 Tax=Facklamia sp. P13069 TaxID=3421954 RepID=UPI003D171269
MKEEKIYRPKDCYPPKSLEDKKNIEKRIGDYSRPHNGARILPEVSQTEPPKIPTKKEKSE